MRPSFIFDALAVLLIAVAIGLAALHWLQSLAGRRYFIRWPLVHHRMVKRGLTAKALRRLVDTPGDPLDWSKFRKRLKCPVDELTVGFVKRLAVALDTPLWMIAPGLATVTVAQLLRRLPISPSSTSFTSRIHPTPASGLTGPPTWQRSANS